MKNLCLLFALGLLITLTSFSFIRDNDKMPGTITRTTEVLDGNKVERTVILLDGTTSREELIHTCNFLAAEKVQLTFDRLVIGKSLLGLVGKSRIRIAEGKIELPDGSSENFKAGGVTSFKSIRIQYSSNDKTKSPIIEMIEIID